MDGEEVELSEEDKEKMRMHKDDGQHMMIHLEEASELPEDMEKMIKNIEIMVHAEEDTKDLTPEQREELKKAMEQVHIELEGFQLDLDSLMEIHEIEIEELIDGELEDGEHKVFIKKIEIDTDSDFDGKWSKGEQSFGMMRIEIDGQDGEDFTWTSEGGDEGFTIVLVSEVSDSKGDVEDVRIQIMAEDQMIVFPNPNEGSFTVQFKVEEKAKTLVQIVDAQGKTVFEDKLGKFQGEYKKVIDLQNSGAGTYIVSLQSGDRITKQTVVVK